jgi:hypothetical protein
MTWRSALLVASLAAAAASPPTFNQYTFVAPVVPAPDPAMPNGFSAFAPAPVPDPDVVDPAKRPVAEGTSLSPKLSNPHPTLFQGDGFTPNSTEQTEEDRHYRPAPSLNLNVPLQ